MAEQITAPGARTPARGSLPALIARHGGFLATCAAAVAGLAALRSFVLDPLQGRFTGAFEDFQPYWEAANLTASGRSPYATFDASTVTMGGFDYPPFAAVLARPLALLDHHAAATAFLWIGLACLIAGAAIAARTLLPPSWPAARLGIVAVLVFPPATYNLFHGQANPILFLLLALALRSWVRGEELRCGAILGVAAAIKVAPALLLLALLRRRWWRGSLAMVSAGVASSVVGAGVIGWDATRTWITTVLPALGRDNGWLYNQTWGGAISRLANHSVLTWQGTSLPVRGITLLVAAATVGLAAWVVRPGARPVEARGLEFGAAVAAMLLAGSVAWYPHEVHLLLPLLALAGSAAVGRVRPTTSMAVAVGGAVVALCVVVPSLIAGTSMADLQARSGSGLGWWVYIQLWSAPVLVTAATLWACCRALGTRSEGGKAATAAATV